MSWEKVGPEGIMRLFKKNTSYLLVMPALRNILAGPEGQLKNIQKSDTINSGKNGD
jgi:hypothetical protein